MSQPVSQRTNEFGQPIGEAVPGWKPPPVPARIALEGRYARLEPLNAEAHARSLFEAYSADTEGRMWTYLAIGPYAEYEPFLAEIEQRGQSADPLFYAIVEQASNRALGIASYLRITPAAGSIEVGHLAFAPALQRTPVATDAMYLMAKHAFELGYRRYEWKCDALNAPSRAAAERYGFTYEGVFRQALVYRGRNRDTAWFAMVDKEWPALQAAFEQWLAPGNFDADGRQRTSLRSLTQAALAKAHQ